MSQTDLADATVKITSVLNKHLAESPDCKHTVREITKEIFQN